VDHNFFAPRRTQQRDNDNDNNNNNERQQHRQRVDDNTNEANVDDSVIGELYPPPIFATNYSLSGGQEGNADDIESALRVNENPYTLANQALLNQRRIVGPDLDIPPRNRSHSGSSKSKSRHTTAVSTTNECPTDPEVSSVSAQPNRSRSHSNQSSRTTAGSTTNERSSADPDNHWPEHHLQFLKVCIDELEAAVNFRINRHDSSLSRYMGKYPRHLLGIISPSADPLGWFSEHPLSMDHFDLPDFLIWIPEAQYPSLYPAARPCCPWCKTTVCVESNGWMTQPRTGYSAKRKCAIIGKKYSCKRRRDADQHPFNFRGIDNAVIANSHDYVKMIWRRYGYHFTHKAGVKIEMIEDLRSLINQGISFSGYHLCHLEDIKRYHLQSSAMYRSYVDSLNDTLVSCGSLSFTRKDVEERMQDFHAFDSNIYNQPVPSLAYLILHCVREMERDNEFKMKRMQMIDGKHLSGDHSFKLAKCVVSNRTKTFTAMYCIMNEFGQVVAWWLTAGTGMMELEPMIKKLFQRYGVLGYNEPESFTTDSCCKEREFWNRLLQFHCHDGNVDSNVNNEDVERIQVADMPYDTRATAYEWNIAVVYLGEVSDYLANQQEGDMTIVLDCEWNLGSRVADTVSIYLPNANEAPYTFSLWKLRQHSVFMTQLKSILEDSRVAKVGNHICTDVAWLSGLGINMNNTVDLGHLAFDRAVTPTKSPSLELLVDCLWTGVHVDGKKRYPQLSAWNSILDIKQERYASNDVYIEGMVYKKLMHMSVPKNLPKITVHNLVEYKGQNVTLYATGWKSKVARGVLTGERVGKSAIVSITLSEVESNVFASNTLVKAFLDEGSMTTTQDSFASLKTKVDAGDITSSVVNVLWPLFWTRETIKSNVDIHINTLERDVIVEYYGDEQDELYERDELDDDSSDGESLCNNDNNNSNDGEDNDNNDAINDGKDNNSATDGSNIQSRRVRRRLNCQARRRLHKYKLRSERVKNDIAHIFFRFEKVLSKDHGAYPAFRRALRSAIYVNNQSDMEACKYALRNNRGLDNKAVDGMLLYNFNWFKKRVRRHVPDPLELKRRYVSVVEEFKDIVDAKTSLPLFGPRAMALHHQVLLHIRKNCISDIPYVSYYTPYGKDKLGLTLYKCLRGTDSLEGLHQKLRQLIRGFSVSPRLTISIISDYLLRWNHNIDVKIRGLSSVYDGIYEYGQLLEDEIEKMSKWPNRDEPPHPDWISTRSFVATGEYFGLVDGMTRMQVDDDNQEEDDGDDDRSDTSLNNQIEEAVDNFDYLDTGVEGSEDTPAVDIEFDMTASERWLAAQHGRSRAFGRVKGKYEWEKFRQMVPSYQRAGRRGSLDHGADNHSSISFSSFATDWNKMVDDLSVNECPSFTYKTASLMQIAFKRTLKSSNEKLTLRSHSQQLHSLQQSLDETPDDMQAEFTSPNESTRVRPAPNATDIETQARPETVNAQVQVQTCCELGLGGCLANSQPTNTRKPKRCRNCGVSSEHDNFRQWHSQPPLPVTGNGSENLRNTAANQVHDFCNTPNNEIQIGLGYPLKEGQRHPRRR